MCRIGSWYGEFVLPHEQDVSYNVLLMIADLHPYFRSSRAKENLSEVFDLEEHECEYLGRDRLVTREHLLEHVCFALAEKLINIRGLNMRIRGLTYRPWMSPFHRVYLDVPLTMKGSRELLKRSWMILEKSMKGDVISEHDIQECLVMIALEELAGQDEARNDYKDPVRVVRERNLRRVKRFRLREDEKSSRPVL